jgi:hypothetical protein
MPLGNLLQGYLAAKQGNEAAATQQLQQFGAVQQIMAQQKAAHDAAAIQSTVQGAGGDREATIKALLATGNPNAIGLALKMQEAGKGQSIGAGGLRLPSGEVVPPAVKPETGYTLAPGATRFGPNNQPLASTPANPPKETLKAIMGPGGKGILVPESQAVGKEPYSPSIAGAGMLAPDTLAFTAQQYLTGDKSAVQGYSRNATMRAALQTAIVQQAKIMGMSGPDVAAKMADYAGIMAGSRTVGQRQANIALASNEAIKMMDIVKQRSDAFARTNFIPFNKALAAYESGTGAPEVKALGQSINSLVNVYARAINPTGVPTVEDKREARQWISEINSPAQVEGVLAVLKQEMQAANDSPPVVRAALRAAITGKGAPAEAPRDQQFTEGQTASGPNGQKIIFRGGQWVPFSR